MATLRWNDIEEITRDEGLQQTLELLDDQGLTATSWQEGAIAPVMVNLRADTLVKLSRIAVFLRDTFNAETAAGEGLTHTLQGFYDLTRSPATTSQHLVTLACATGEGPHVIALGDVVLSHPDGHTYRNVEGNSVVYPYTLTSGTSKTFLFESEAAGAASNIGPASGDAVELELVTTLSGVTITENAQFRLGTDEETDALARARAQAQWSLLTQYEVIDDAVKAMALASSGGITRVGVDSTNPRGPYTFDVYIGGTDATAADDDVAKAQTFIQNRVRNGPQVVRVRKATEVAVDLTGQVFFSETNATAAEVQAAVEATLLAFIRAAPLGGYSFPPIGPANKICVNDLETEIKNVEVNGVRPVKTVVLTVPSSDIAIPVYGLAIRGSWSLTYIVTNGPS